MLIFPRAPDVLFCLIFPTKERLFSNVLIISFRIFPLTLLGRVPLKFALLVPHLFYPDPNCLCGPAKPNVACPPDGTFGAVESCGKTLEGRVGGVDVTRCGEGRLHSVWFGVI